MPLPYTPGDVDAQEVAIVFPDADGVALTRWVSYEFRSNFLTPSDSFSFELGVDEEGFDPEVEDAIRFGAKIQLRLDGREIATGRIDAIDISADRPSGNTISIHGRDLLGQTLDTTADPTYELKAGGTLADLLKDLFSPFGWKTEDDFVIDPRADRDAKAGIRGTPTTRGGKKKGPKPLKSFILHQTKPYNHESVYHFASRVAQRHGLWIWLSADGKKLNVGQPDFEGEPYAALFRTRDGRVGTTNVTGTVSLDMTNQPTVILADSFGGGSEYAKGRFRAYMINPLLGFDEDGNVFPEVAAFLAKAPSATKNEMPRTTFFRRAKNIPFRPMILHDPESKTPEQLNNFVRREMSLLVRQGVRAHYNTEGHGLATENGVLAWTPNTLVHVTDDAAGLDEDMYILGTRLAKSRGGGTTSSLDLILKNSIAF